MIAMTTKSSINVNARFRMIWIASYRMHCTQTMPIPSKPEDFFCVFSGSKYVYGRNPSIIDFASQSEASAQTLQLAPSCPELHRSVRGFRQHDTTKMFQGCAFLDPKRQMLTTCQPQKGGTSQWNPQGPPLSDSPTCAGPPRAGRRPPRQAAHDTGRQPGARVRGRRHPDTRPPPG